MQAAVIPVPQLDEGFVLAPERYDPRRLTHASDGAPLLNFARISRDIVTPIAARTGKLYLVLDTGDAREGFIFSKRAPVTKDQLGSAKKLLRSGDVIVSRLRPYLRQVALVDPGLVNFDEIDVVCSTEFYVLRAQNAENIAFLVPFLLSQPVQDILAASQEGGHHPRFNDRTLAALTVPERVLVNRGHMSAQVAAHVDMMRKATSTIAALVQELSS